EMSNASNTRRGSATALPADRVIQCRSLPPARREHPRLTFFEREVSVKARTILLALLTLVLSSSAFAQEPVVGVADPESLFKDSDAKLNRNKQAALHIMRELLQCGQWDRSGEWLTDKYIQHNPNAASGRAGVVVFFTQVLKVKRQDTCGKLT